MCLSPLGLQVALELSRDAPCSLLKLTLGGLTSGAWRGGLVCLDGVISRLRELLPATFEELEVEFAVSAVRPFSLGLIGDGSRARG